jgi:hypothetical protein
MIEIRMARAAALAAAAALLLGASPQRTTVSHSVAANPPSTLVVRELPAIAGQPSGQPQLAVDAQGRVVVSWLERIGNGPRYAFKYSFRVGDGWGPARTIVERDNFFVNWADVPSIFPLNEPGGLVAHWLQKNGAGSYAYDVRIARSDPEARTWTADRLPYADASQTEHGFASFFHWPGGGTGIVWLDGRDMKAGTTHDTQGGSGAMTLRVARIDRTGAMRDEARIDARVCECCPTAAVATASGALIAYRDRTDSEVRDIGVMRLANGKWTGPTYVHVDGWRINACPVNGPALAAAGDRVALAWFTAEADAPRAMVAFSIDGGQTFGRPIRADEAQTLGRVDVEMLDNGSALVSWLEFTANGSEFRVREVSPDGRRGPHVTITPASSDRQSGYPRMVRSGKDVIFAWTATRPALQVKTAGATLR